MKLTVEIFGDLIFFQEEKNQIMKSNVWIRMVRKSRYIPSLPPSLSLSLSFPRFLYFHVKYMYFIPYFISFLIHLTFSWPLLVPIKDCTCYILSLIYYYCYQYLKPPCWLSLTSVYTVQPLTLFCLHHPYLLQFVINLLRAHLLYCHFFVKSLDLYCLFPVLVLVITI